jgi:myo-inositol-1(or 4)-monophosphatase
MLPTLSDLVLLASQAGEVLRSGFGQKHQIQHKGAIDLVTETDHRSEELLLSAIRQRFPSHRIITEESGILSGESEYIWYIDPLDGTVNFAHNLPIFCVSIAFGTHQEALLGVIFDPLRDECFSAERGQGACLNGRPIHVSETQDLGHSLLATGFPYDMWNNPHNNLEYFNRFSLQTQGVRRLGSAALDLCYVASGRLDGFWEIDIRTYDIAAGALIVQEAGGVSSRIDGRPDYLQPPCNILAANPSIHPLMVEVLQTGGMR